MVAISHEPSSWAALRAQEMQIFVCLMKSAIELAIVKLQGRTNALMQHKE